MPVANALWKIAAKSLWKTGVIDVLATALARTVVELPVPVDVGRDDQRITLLALNPARFRGDLEILNGTGRFRILKLPFHWQCRLVYLFYSNKAVFDDYYQPDRNPTFARRQEQLRKFLRAFLPKFYGRLGVDGVVGAAVHFVQDYDWGRISNELGVPYFVFHRENLITNEGHRQVFIKSGRRLRHFVGSQVIVHNEEVRECYIQSGFVQPEEISALGCLRMDDFARACQELPRRDSRPRRKVVLFSFTHDGGAAAFKHFSGGGFVHLFESVHTTIATLAQRRPDVDFLIKPKFGGKWLDNIEAVLDGRCPDWRALQNLEINADIDAHEAIFDADVVASFGSTVLLEAAIAGRPVIMPMYHEAADPDFEPYVQFSDRSDIFDMAHSEDELVSLIERRLDEYEVDASLMERRCEAFSRLVSPVSGDALLRYQSKIEEVVAQGSPS